MKKLIITVDAEGDNLWEYLPGDDITTENAAYVDRFQSLCEKYNFKPTYLVTYEMACNLRFCEFLKNKLQENCIEVGMHMHGWSTPPYYTLNLRDGIQKGENPFIYEYPSSVIDLKIKEMNRIIRQNIGVDPVSHRSGRWAINHDYCKLLRENGYIVDCSVYPGVKMGGQGFTEGSIGPDFRGFPTKPYIIGETGGLIEVPMTLRTNHFIKQDGRSSVKHDLYKLCKAVKGRGVVNLRPSANNLSDMINYVKLSSRIGPDYLMFAFHTSEMMPGCSPAYPDKESIEKLYRELDILFKCIQESYEGITLSEYANMIKNGLQIK